MNIILIGGPGSGKSTYSEFITKELGIDHIYPGELLRKEKEKGGEIAKRLSNLGKGEFAPNDIVLKLIKDAVAKADKGFVFDGYPRYMKQVRDMEKEGIKIDKVVYLNVSPEEVIKRLTARGRADDKPEVIRNRIALYKKETGPVVEYYRNKPGFIEVKAEGDKPEVIAKDIISKLKQKSLKEMREYLSEGVYDPGIFKAFFLAGGPGSGKTFVTSSAFAGTGLKVVNSDKMFERGLKKAGLSMKMPASEEDFRNVIRNRAKTTARNQLDKYMEGRLGLVIDATGRDLPLISQQVNMLRYIGYDCYMIFVNTSLEVALERNKNRPRTIPEYIVQKSWEGVQSNIGAFQRVFSPNKMFIVDNNRSEKELVTMVLNSASKFIRSKLRTKPESQIAANWIKRELMLKKR
jgi:adenylate kinase|tara:strand:+ start:1827 stop:3044 length:1218 start_codon:yes stop_codon:yes gene_type:complete